MDEYVQLSRYLPASVRCRFMLPSRCLFTILFAPFLLSLLCHSIWFYLLYLVAGFYVFIAGVFYHM